MPLDTSLQASQVTVGKLDEIAPDLPVGAWTGSALVKNRVNDAGYHQLIIEWTAEESQTDSDEGVGGAVAEFITFSPNALKMAKVRVKEICEAYQIEVPDGTCLEEGTVEGLEGFVEALESEKRPFWTTHKTSKDGEIRVRVHCTEPAKLERAPDDDEEQAKPKTNGKTPPKASATAKKKVKR